MQALKGAHGQRGGLSGARARNNASYMRSSMPLARSCAAHGAPCALGPMAPASLGISLQSRKSRRQAVRCQAFFQKLFKQDPSENTRKKYQARVDAVNALEPQMQALSDEKLREMTQKLKDRYQKGESLDALLPEAFAVSAGVAPEAMARWHALHCTSLRCYRTYCLFSLNEFHVFIFCLALHSYLITAISENDWLCCGGAASASVYRLFPSCTDLSALEHCAVCIASCTAACCLLTQQAGGEMAFFTALGCFFTDDILHNSAAPCPTAVGASPRLFCHLHQVHDRLLQCLFFIQHLLSLGPQVVREASKRVLGLRPFDVQLIGGMILHEGQIAEMRTGEGKTLVAVLPAFLNALTSK